MKNVLPDFEKFFYGFCLIYDEQSWSDWPIGHYATDASERVSVEKQAEWFKKTHNTTSLTQGIERLIRHSRAMWWYWIKISHSEARTHLPTHRHVFSSDRMCLCGSPCFWSVRCVSLSRERLSEAWRPNRRKPRTKTDPNLYSTV